jgi:putative methyltransferase
MKRIYFLSLNMIPFVPYSYGMLRGYAEQDRRIAENYEWMAPFWEMVPVEDLLKKIVDPDILCASCFLWNCNRQLEAAKRVKERYPGCRVILGGPQIPNGRSSFLDEHPYVDILVHGEGEEPLEALLIGFLEKDPVLDRVPGISYRAGGRTRRTGKDRLLPQTLPIPSPYLNGLFDGFLNDPASVKMGLLETNRGCPFSCGFCDWGSGINKVRTHDTGKVFREIEAIARYRIEEIYLADANFGLLDRDLDIARAFVDAKKRYGYPKGLRINFSNKLGSRILDISKLLYENDMLWGTTLTLQSLDKEVLNAINRPAIDVGRYEKLKRSFSELGIPTYTELILGLPLETRETFLNGICTLLNIGIHEDIRVHQLALLPNAPISQETERQTYGFHTKIRPLRLTEENGVAETVELVFGTTPCLMRTGGIVRSFPKPSRPFTTAVTPVSLPSISMTCRSFPIGPCTRIFWNMRWRVQQPVSMPSNASTG